MSDYFFYDINKKMADLAAKQQLAEDAQAAPAKPSPLMEAAADYSATKARAGKDIGKPGKNFAKIAAGAAKRYGSKAAGERVAGAVLNKLRHPTEESMDESAFQAAIGKKKYGDQGMKALQKAGRDHASQATMDRIRNRYDKYDESQTDEGNAFSKAVVDAKKDGVQPGEKIRVGGRQYDLKEVDATPQDVESYKDPVKAANAPQRKASAPVVTPKKTMPPTKKPAMYPPQAIDDPVKEGGVPMTAKQKKFAALAPPVDKITFADKIVGAKKEVDEVLGDVAATAMKKAVGKMSHHHDMEEGWLDDEPTRRRSSSGGEIDTSQPGRTIHRAVRGAYSGAGHDASADDEPSGALGRRRVGAGQGKKIGAKINRGTSKLMTREGDMPEDMIQSQDPGEYDQEGAMAKDDIKTVVRHAQALEKILGDNDNLPEWVQAKLAKIEGMMTAVDDYMQNQKSGDSNSDEMDEESTAKRDSRAERAGRKVAKEIEYDEKKKDGIHGKRRGSEDNKAERAGKQVTKDIEHDEKKKHNKKKAVDETTTSGSVATGAAPKSNGAMSFGKGIYDSLNRELENMISESMNINMSMNNDEHGGPSKSLTVTATDDDAEMLAGLLKMAGLGHGSDHIHAMTGDDDMQAIHDMDHAEPCETCGSTSCGCDDEVMDEDRWGAEQTPKLPHDMTVTGDGGIDVTKSNDKWVYKSKDPGGRVTVTIPAKAANKMFPTNVDEDYGDTDASENHPDWPTAEEGTDDAMMYGGGLNGPKSTGQTTVPVIAGQRHRMGHDGLDEELSRMIEMAGITR